MRSNEVKSSARRNRAFREAFPYDAGVVRLGAFLVLGLTACAAGGPRTIPRVVDGAVELGPIVSPYAYEWFIRGELSAGRGDHEEAAIAFENATAASNADALLMARLAEELDESGASRRADRTLALARRSHPESARVALAEGRILHRRGDDQGAISALVRARRLAPTRDEPVVAMAEVLHERGHRRRANAILLEHVMMMPEGHAGAARRLSIDLARRTGDADTLRRALFLDPNMPSGARARAAGQLALETGRPALAARILDGETSSRRNAALWARALVESGARTKLAAVLSSREGAGLGTDLQRARLLVTIGEAERALPMLEASEPSPALRYERGHALWTQGRYLPAAARLADVPFGAADFEVSRLALADCSLALGRRGAAAESLSTVPHGSLAVRTKLAEIYLEADAMRPALRLFDPTVSAERAVLASLFEHAGRFEEAAAYYASVVVGSNDGPALRARASAERLVSRGSIEAAIATLEHWAMIAPEDLYARVRLVELLREHGRVEAARREGRRVFELIGDRRLSERLKELLAGL